MDCPHCGAEALIGAKLCVACGGNLAAPPAPKPRGETTMTQAVAPAKGQGQPQPAHSATVTQFPNRLGNTPTVTIASLPGAPAHSATVTHVRSPLIQRGERGSGAVDDPQSGGQSICRVCMEGFDRASDEQGPAICPKCRNFNQAGADPTVNDVTLHPASQDNSVVDVVPPTPRKSRRLERRVSLRAGPVAAALGLVLGLSSLAIVKYVNREKDPAAEYLSAVRLEDAAFAVAPSKTAIVRLEATYDLALTRELVRSNFSSQLEEILNLGQKSVQTADVAWARDQLRGAVLDTAVESRVALQTGTANGADGREAKVHPWEGYAAKSQVVVPETGAIEMGDGSAPTPGRDLPPCFSVRDIGAPEGSVAVGTTWKATVTLPVLMSRNGALRNAPFPCELTYVGRVVENGISSYVVKLRGGAPARPGDVVEEMNRATAVLRGVLLYEATTGILTSGHLDVATAVWLDKGRVEDRLRVEGTVDFRRR